MRQVLLPPVFDLEQTLDCGQAFRWEPAEGGWQGIAMGKKLLVRMENGGLVFHCTDQEFGALWRDYFDLETDYEEIKATLSEMSPLLKLAAEFAPGIRILRQEPWEALCSFIISQNNNIPRIKGIINRICTLLGEDIGGGFTFPTPEAMAACTVEDLASVRSGFRAKYLIDAATAVANGRVNLQAVLKMPIEEARNELMKMKGVGPKVAECALLYGFHRMECFPMDVWMKRAMSVLLPNNSPADFGKNAGIAQQYIFHYSRMNPKLFE